MVGDGSGKRGNKKPKKRKPGNPGTARGTYNVGDLEDLLIDCIDYERSKNDPRYKDEEFLRKFIFSEAATFKDELSYVFFMRFDNGWKPEKIATRLGVSRAIVSERIADALNLMEKRLALKLWIYLKGGKL